MPENVNTSPLGNVVEQDTEQDDRPVMVNVDHVSMVFNMANEQLNSLKEYAIALARRELMFKEFRALDDVSFTINAGEVLGIAGIAGDECRQGQVGVRKALGKHPAHLVVLLIGCGVCRNGKAQHGVVRPDGPQVCHKVVAGVQHRHRRARLKGAAAGAAGQKQCHNDPS